MKGNAGAAGVDGQSVKQFAVAGRKSIWQNSSERSGRKSTGQSRSRRVEIPKAGGKMRPLGIPAVKDRIVQTALKLVIEPIFEREFEESSYGFRPRRSCERGTAGSGWTDQSKATPMWWMLTWRVSSTRSPHAGPDAAGRRTDQ